MPKKVFAALNAQREMEGEQLLANTRSPETAPGPPPAPAVPDTWAGRGDANPGPFLFLIVQVFS